MDTAVFLSNLHCASCVRTIERTLFALQPAPLSVDVSIVYQSVSVSHPPALTVSRIQAALDDAGFDLLDASAPSALPSRKRTRHIQQCALCQNSLKEKGALLDPSLSSENTLDDSPHKVTLSVGGMTCSSCAAAITERVSCLPGVSEIAVSLLSNSATVRVENMGLVSSVADAVDGCGFQVELISAEPILPSSSTAGQPPSGLRTITLRVDGMYCRHCPRKVLDALHEFFPAISVIKPFKDYNDSLIEISYEPAPPNFTIRTIISRISSIDPAFTASPHCLPTLEQRSRSMQLHEQTILLRRLLFTFVIAVPAFVIGVVYMSLVPSGNPSKIYLMEPMWNGNASRIQWSLFFIATPVMFYSAGTFHRRCIKEMIATWRKGSPSPIIARFTRFGSMSLLVSAGVSVAYFASVTLLALAASQPPAGDGIGDTTTYFDSVVFLTLFLLCGRYLEAYSKERTTDAITALASLRPTVALLLVPRNWSEPIRYSLNTDIEKGDPHFGDDNPAVVPGQNVEKVPVDLLEVGDVVRILNGATPPSDGTIVSGTETSFDESSLTGESRPIKKKIGDQVFLGTINKARAVDVRLDAIGGLTMLDNIMRIVREGQTRRAPIERIADMVTSVFVPIITLLAIITWVVWLALGLGGALPHNYLDIPGGSWTVWSLEFAIAVFVVACPCGIGLAAPTALLVGSGLAAKYGILARGGGEAFQEMAQVDVIVFDKTGTLTEGGEPRVSDFEVTRGSTWTVETVLGIAAELESASSHPLGRAIKQCAAEHGAAQSSATAFDEVAGRGIKARFDALNLTALIGNEPWMREHGAVLDGPTTTTLAKWSAEAKSIVLLALGDDNGAYSIVAVFAVTDPLRAEAPGVIRRFHDMGVDTWMISGDNAQTVQAVAKTVGIPEMNVLAGVLPHQKAAKIEWLQTNGVKRLGSRWQRWFSKKATRERRVVAMVGDGINDAPALATSDVGIAIGSGSDVAISSASFILVSSNLASLLTLCDLSHKVLSRVKQNFVWAFMYNVIAVPIAAGVIYPAGHVRLAPVWASLAMALSSISVVLSSLSLKLYREPKV